MFMKSTYMPLQCYLCFSVYLRSNVSPLGGFADSRHMKLCFFGQLKLKFNIVFSLIKTQHKVCDDINSCRFHFTGATILKDKLVYI